MGEVRVEPLGPDTIARWDEFIAAAPNATFFHLAGWRNVIHESFSHDCPYLLASREGRITGVLPLVHVKSRFFGSALISTAFAVTGGPVAEDLESEAALDRAALALAEERDADYIEYRLTKASTRNWPRAQNRHANFQKSLQPETEANFKAIPRKRRAELRKAIARDLTFKIESSTDTFFAIYAESVRNLGTPVFPSNYFRNLAAEFGPACEILSVQHQGLPVSSVMSFFFRGSVLPYYGGGISRARDLGANDFMYWQAMCRAVERGCSTFDFGRSRIGSGAFAYKTHWGFSPQPLCHEFHLRRGDDLPNVNPTNSRYRTLALIWQKLPLGLANRLGPLISRGLG